MVYFLTSLPVLLISAAVALATPVSKHITVPFKAVKENPDYSKALEADRTRWSNLSSKSSSSTSAINEEFSYFITISIGTPAQNAEVIFDTGSSDFWVKSSVFKPTHSSTIKSLGETFEIGYGSGSAYGKEYKDTIKIGDLKFTQEFGVASQSSGFSGVQGLVGFGPDDLSVITNKGENIPTPIDNAYTSGLIPSKVVGVYFAPLENSATSSRNGEITFGGVDSTKFTGSIKYVPVTSTAPSNTYWGIDVSSFAYGTSKLSGHITGIVDTGTTLILFSDSLTSRFYSHISGAKLDNKNGLYVIPKSQVSKLKNVSLTIGGKAFTLTPSQYLVPADQVINNDGTKGDTYSWIGSIGDNIQGLEFILGQKFLEHYYSVYDTTHNRVGLAPNA